MKRREAAKVSEKRYVVAIPIPSLDRSGKKLRKGRIKKWTRIIQRELSRCFGGATPIAAPGTNIVGNKLLFERDQILVLSACDDRREYLSRRSRVEKAARRMGIGLNQESVFVLAIASDSFLIEWPRDARRGL